MIFMFGLTKLNINKQIYSQDQMRQGVYSAPKYLHKYPSQTVKKWPQDIECIIKSSDPDRGSLYLSNVEAAENPATVKKLRVGAILSCAKGYIISHPTSLVSLYKYIPGEDKQSFDISLHFDEAVQFIHRALQRTNIIVHCIAGVSRSASMVIAYFMKHRRMSYHQAFSEVKSKRKIISPNDGFIEHLKRYEEKLRFSLNDVNRFSFQNQEDKNQYYRTLSGQFYSPTRKFDYQRNLNLLKSTKNPESSYKQETRYKNYQPESTPFYSPSKTFDSFKNFKSQSMTLIPQSSQKSPRYQDKLGKSISKQLSPRKTVLYTTQKPRALTRDTLYQTKVAKSGYFDSMNEQLNAKIDAIRKKYEQQRQQLMKSHASRPVTSQKQSQKSIYFQRKPASYNNNNSFTEQKDYYKNANKRDMFRMYDRTVDVRTNPRLSNINDFYVPRITTGYGYGFYGKRY